MHVEKPRKLARRWAFLLLSAVAPHAAYGQASLSFSESKNWQQFGPKDLRFKGGDLTVNIQDGSFSLGVCAAAPSQVIVQPDPMIPCPLGTTGFITSGDVDNDGINDVNRFFAVAAVKATTAIEPFQPGRVSLYSGPASPLPRPLSGFRDVSVQIYYNYITPPVLRYRITRYTFTRTYPATDLNRMWNELREGSYTFKIPNLVPDPKPANWRDSDSYLTVNHDPPLDAYPGKQVVTTNSDWILLNDANWRNGEIELDPRIGFRFDWRGFNGASVRLGDTTDFSMVDTATGLIVYPPYPNGTPAGDRVPQRIVTPSTGIDIGPYLYTPGTRMRAQISFQRNAATNAVCVDNSSRLFEWDVFFIDTYPGFTQAAFPAGTTAAQSAPTFDFDGDGWTNLEEFALQSDPADAASTPVARVRPTRDPNSGQIILNVAKRPFVGDRLVYQIQYSYDRVTWTTVTATDPVYFLEFDTADGIRVRSRRPAPPENSFVRVKITQN